MNFNLTVVDENVIFMGLNVCFYINYICICNNMSYIYFVTGTTIKSAVWWQQLYIAKGTSTECYRRSGSQHYPSSLTVYQPNESSCWCILYILSHSIVFPSDSRHSQWHHNWHPCHWSKCGECHSERAGGECNCSVSATKYCECTVCVRYGFNLRAVFCSQTWSSKAGSNQCMTACKRAGICTIVTVAMQCNY